MNELAQFYKNNKYLHWERWGTLAFIVYCLSTLFMIFCSVPAIQVWPYPWNQLSIISACLLPLLLVFIWKIPEWIQKKELRNGLLFVPIIVIIGALNIFFSEDRPTTFKAMTLFLISGIGAFGITNCVLNTKLRQTIFLWLSWSFLLVLCVYGLYEYSTRSSNYYPIVLFSYNTIPADSLLILLIVGPALFLHQSNWWLCFAKICSLLLALVVIFLSGIRGPIIGLIGMAFLLGILQIKKFWFIPLITLLLIGIGFNFRHHLPNRLQINLVTNMSTTIRIENYFFAVHIFPNKPLLGIGLHAPLVPYLADYRVKLKHLGSYPQHIKKNKTLENIFLLSFVEMGVIMTITYLLLIIFLLRKLFRDNWKDDRQKLRVTLFLAPLFGFIIHSMTFDSLMYPHLNWLFHSYLGMMVNFDKFCSKN